MTDVNWVYALVQAGATFAAIVGAFFTTKILSIASERRGLQTRIDQVRIEIPEKKEELTNLKETIDRTELDGARDRFEAFHDDIMDALPTYTLPTADGIKEVYERVLRNRNPKYELDTYDLQALAEFSPSFIEEFRKKMAARVAEEERQRRIRQGGVTAIIAGATPLPRAILSLPSLPRTRVSKEDVARLRENYSRHANLERNISVLVAEEKRYQSDISSLLFPKYVRAGFIALVYLLLATVVLPLWLARSWSTLPSCSTDAVFLLFLSGLAVMIMYLYAEITYAINPKSPRKPPIKPVPTLSQ